MPQDAEQLIAIARTNLERIRDAMDEGDPFAPAPPAGVEALHAVLTVIATPERQVRYRLDALHGVNRRYLRRHVERVLRDFDGLVATNPRLQDLRDDPA